METISVVIPAYNEEKRIGKTLDYWASFLKNSDLNCREIIIVDDGSKDRTSEIAASYKNCLPIKTIKIKENQGKGNAVRAGVLESLGDMVFVYDADAAAKPDQINKILSQINSSDIVIGSRITKGAKIKMSFKRRFVGVCFHLFCLALLPGIKDASCGAKLFKRNAAQKIFKLQTLKRFAYDIEILWLAKKLNLKIKEVGIEWEETPGSKVRILRDSLEMFFAVLYLYKKQIFG
jgi:dolichyl-phosphate beta-glucosyltransferase